MFKYQFRFSSRLLFVNHNCIHPNQNDHPEGGKVILACCVINFENSEHKTSNVSQIFHTVWKGNKIWLFNRFMTPKMSSCVQISISFQFQITFCQPQLYSSESKWSHGGWKSNFNVLRHNFWKITTKNFDMILKFCIEPLNQQKCVLSAYKT